MTKVLVIGAAGLDWAGFLRRRASGALPALDALRRRGAVGVWQALPAPGELAAWGCLATGQLPETHGLWRAAEAFGGGIRPATRASWISAPIWATLSAAGVAVASVDWPGSRPGASWPGIHFDEDFAEPTGKDSAQWALPPHCAPAELREEVRDIRVHPTEITAEMLKPFAPDLENIDQSRDTGLPRLALAVARAASIQAAAAWVLDRRDTDVVFVRQAWLSQVRAVFEGAQAPFDQVAEAAWSFADGLVRYLVELAGPDRLILVASPGWMGRPGLLLAAGPGVSADTEPQTWDMLDLAPTILARFGLNDPGLPGKRLEAIAPRPGGQRAPRVAPDPPPPTDAALLGGAVRAGYAPPAPASDAWRAQGLAELSALMLSRDPARAAEVAGAAQAMDRGNVLALSIRAGACVLTEDAAPLPELAQALMKAAPDRGWGALAQGAFHVIQDEPSVAAPWLAKAESDPDVETRLRVAAAWIAADRSLDAERVFKAVLEQDPDNASAEIGLAFTARVRRDFLQAEQRLIRALRLDAGRAAAHLQLAAVYGATGRPELADRAAAAAMRLGVAAEQAARVRRADDEPGA